MQTDTTVQEVPPEPDSEADRTFRTGTWLGIPLGTIGGFASIGMFYLAVPVLIGLALLLIRRTRPAGLGFLNGIALGFFCMLILGVLVAAFS